MKEGKIRSLIQGFYVDVMTYSQEMITSVTLRNKVEKLVSQLSKHSDENTEAYCENLQRENDYLKEQLSRQDEVVAVFKGIPYSVSGDIVNWCLNQDQEKEFIISIKEVE